jgi:signal transduction histidine kinase
MQSRRRHAAPSPDSPSTPPVDPRSAALDVLPVAVAVLRADDGVVRYANDRFRSLLSLPGSVVDAPLDPVIGAPGAHAALVAGADGPGVEVRGRRTTGEFVWMVASSRRITFADEPDALLVVFQDVTGRRQADEQNAAHTASLALLAELPEKNPGPVCRLARDGTVLMANAAARAFLGGDVRGGSWLELCPGMTPQLWQRVLDSDGRTTHEAERNGTCVLFTHVRSDSGDLVFAYGADITARRRNEQLLAEQAKELKEIARFPDMNPGPVLRLDNVNAVVLMANTAARGVFGADLIGRSWRELCPDLTDDAWRQVLDATGPVPIEARIADREYVFAHRHDPHTRLVFVFGADVSAQKKAERALRQSEKMATLGTLAAGVAHELNNPAAATRRAADHLRDAFADLEDAHLRMAALAFPREGWSVLRSFEERARERAARPGDLGPLERADREAEMEEWLDEQAVADPWDLAPPLVAQGLDPGALASLADLADEEQLSAALKWAAAAFRVCRLSHEIGQGSARISEIVGALKSYSYLGQAPVQAVDIHDGIDNTLVILRNKLKVGIEVRRDYGADVPPITAYGSELNQVWTNLLDNAADAMNGRGEITIRTRRESDRVVVEISDNGPGIPESVQSRIFDPFFTTKPQGKGTGLGLSTSYSIVTEKHKGTISVESRPGFTLFRVRLPIEPATTNRMPVDKA